MRDIKSYSTGEWLCLSPLVHLLKRQRNDLIQNAFVRTQPKSLNRFLQNVAHLEASNIALVVAYQQPWTLDWLAKMAKRHFADCTLLVFDNSRQPQSRADIERVCRDQGIHYLPLPPNPERHPCRSHGLAMNWVYHRIVRSIKPHLFSYIDHDLIPMQQIEFSKILGDQTFYGKPLFSQWGWSLWAGYCLYNFNAISHISLNFLNDVPRRLDTGGRNWSCLYNQHDHCRLQFAESRFVALKDPLDSTPRSVEVIDDKWIHLGGASYSEWFVQQLPFYQRFAAATEDGATLRTLALCAGQQHNDIRGTAENGICNVA